MKLNQVKTCVVSWKGLIIMKFVSIDFETANALRSSVCSMGIVVVQDGVIIEEGHWLIQPQDNYFDSYNIAIHGITPETVADQPEFPGVWPEIKKYLDGQLVVAHNASFDMSVLRHVLDQYDLPYPEFNYSCTWIVSKKVWPGEISYKLPLVAKKFGVTFKHHDALEDARAAAIIFSKALEKYEATTFEDFHKKLGVSIGRIFEGGYQAARSSQSRSGSSFRISDLKPTTDSFSESHPFYNSHIVFTGTLQSMVRKEAMQKVVDAGGHCQNSVNHQTKFLVMGDREFQKFADGKKSSKLKKAEELASYGQEIEIISEEDFLALL